MAERKLTGKISPERTLSTRSLPKAALRSTISDSRPAPGQDTSSPPSRTAIPRFAISWAQSTCHWKRRLCTARDSPPSGLRSPQVSERSKSRPGLLPWLADRCLQPSSAAGAAR